MNTPNGNFIETSIPNDNATITLNIAGKESTMKFADFKSLITPEPTPIPEAPYKVYTALVTQSGGDDFQSQSSGAVQKGVTYYVDGGVIDVTDFSNVGGQFQTPETGSYYFVATIDGVPNEYGGATADYNTGAPVVTVLENTIGNIWFEYSGVGYYGVWTTPESLFPVGKTVCFLGSVGDDTASASYGFLRLAGEDACRILTQDFSNINANGILYNTSIEIRVYN